MNVPQFFQLLDQGLFVFFFVFIWTTLKKNLLVSGKTEYNIYLGSRTAIIIIIILDLNDSMLWLKNNREPFDIILINWKETNNLRYKNTECQN